jgi:hypothetical protein
LLAIITGPIGLAVLEITRHWDSIKRGATDVWQWVKGKFDDLVSFFTGLPGRMSKAFSGMWDGIYDTFRSVIDSVARLWNNTVGSLSFHVPSWVPGLGGKGFDVPDIPALAQGGLMTSSGLVYAHAGEVISPAPATARSGPVVHIEHAEFSDQIDIEVLMSQVAWAARTRRI